LVEECRFLLDTALGQSNVVDRWQWDPDPYDEYTVRGAYQTLTSMVTPTVEATDDLVWHKQVPLKASIVSWRLLKDRLPTRLNLQRRGLLEVAAITCVSGCGNEESASRLFLHCDVFVSLWQYIRSWIGVSGVDPHNISEHLYQFIHYTGHTKARRSFLQLIWLLCVWLI